MLDRITGVVIVGFWLTMMTLLVRQDLVPLWQASQPPSYRSLLEHRLKAERYRMGVFWGGNRLGHSATAIEPEPDGSYQLENDTDLRTPFPGLDRIVLRSRTQIGPQYDLRRFTTDIKTGDLTGKIQARVEGKRLAIDFRFGENEMTHEVPYEPSGTFSNGLSPFVQMPDLSVGKEWTITSINPMTGQPDAGTAKVVELETIEWEGAGVETYKVVLTRGSQEANCWIDRAGRILKEEIPFMSSRLTMVREKEE